MENNLFVIILEVVDGTGEVVNSDAFGNTVDAVEKVQNRFKYAGEQYDAVSLCLRVRAKVIRGTDNVINNTKNV